MRKYEISGYVLLPTKIRGNIGWSRSADEACPMLINVFKQIGLVQDDVELRERERHDRDRRR
jgi:hypothetical protein